MRSAFTRRRARVIFTRTAAELSQAFRADLIDAALIDLGGPAADDAWRAAELARDYPTAAFFGEAGGFVVEVPAEKIAAFEAACTASHARPTAIGTTGGDALIVEGHFERSLTHLAKAWSSPLQELFA